MKKIAVLIPCYNEAQTIAEVVSDYRKALPQADIYVYDNNSTDGTDEAAKKAGALVRYEYRQGKGNVIHTMFREVDADCYLMIDGDNTYSAKHAAEMVQLILDGKADMVIGDRLSSNYYAENKRPFHNEGNKLVRKLINALFKSDIHDVMTGYRAFNKLFVKTYPVLSKGFEVETEMTIFALDRNMKLLEVPIEYRDRPEGSVSKLNTYKDGAKVLNTIITLYRDYKPMSFFGLLSVIFILISLVLFLPVFIYYLKSGLVPQFPTLIVSGVVFLFAMISFICGVILDAIAKKQRQFYEILINLTFNNKIN